MHHFKIRLVFLLFFVITFYANSQDYKFGKVSKEELEEKYNIKDSSSVATVLYRNYNVYYDYMESTGFRVITEVHERIKIYSKEGFDYATVNQLLYRDNSSSEKEVLRGLKATTYNLEGGKIVESKLKSSETFKEEVSDYYFEEKFTMPNVKEGSVIEYKYIHESPFSYNIDEIDLQYDIPIKKQIIQVEIPEYYSFNPRVKGYLNTSPKKSKSSGKINFVNKTRSGSVYSNTSVSYQANTLDFITNISTFDMSDVSALKEEPYVNNMNNYRGAVKYELQYIKYPYSLVENYTTTWEKVAKTIYDSPNFGNQISQTRYFKDVLPDVVEGASTDIKKVYAIFNYVQQYMNWNGNYGKYTDLGVKSAFKEQTGNVADINLMLVSMLKEIGVTSYPVLISTRDNGVPMFPTREGFNYVIASAKINNQIILLDATNKFSEPNLLPQRDLNWFGRLIGDNGESVQIPLAVNYLSTENVIIQTNLLSDGSLEGKMRNTYDKYNAYSFRNNNNAISENDYLEKLENKYNQMEISDYTVTNKKTLGKPISESFSFKVDSQADIIGDKIYFSPAIFKAITKNPFTLESRNFPIDFIYPWTDKILILIKLPEGYKVESTPEPLSLALPDSMGAFTYKITSNSTSMNVLISSSMNRSIISPTNYEALKEFFRLMVEKESEKVVLSKI